MKEAINLVSQQDTLAAFKIYQLSAKGSYEKEIGSFFLDQFLFVQRSKKLWLCHSIHKKSLFNFFFSWSDLTADPLCRNRSSGIISLMERNHSRVTEQIQLLVEFLSIFGS